MLPPRCTEAVAVAGNNTPIAAAEPDTLPAAAEPSNAAAAAAGVGTVVAVEPPLMVEPWNLLVAS